MIEIQENPIAENPFAEYRQVDSRTTSDRRNEDPNAPKQPSILPSGRQDNLQSIVVELSQQVKGLHGLITTEIESKHEFQRQAFGLQDKYFKTVEELKQDLAQFKAKIQEENRSMYSEFQTRMQNLQSQSQNEHMESEEKADEITAKQQVYDFRPAEHEQDSLYQQYSHENQFRQYNIESREHELKQGTGGDEGDFSFDDDPEIGDQREVEIVESYEQDLANFDRASDCKEPVIMETLENQQIEINDQNEQ